MKKKKLAFVWYWDRASQILPRWRDGLRAAIEEIEKEHKVDWFLDKRVPEKDKYHGIIFWDDSNSTFFEKLANYPSAKKAICLTTEPTNMDNLRKLDAVFCESRPILEKVLAGGAKGVLAFGTDTDFYKPDPKVKKDIEYFYPATFSGPWKRQRDIAYLGKKLLCVGTIQSDGYLDLEACERAGVQIEIGYFPAEHIRDLYRRAKRVTIPSVHGSERTVLESMSMNIVPEVTNPINVRAKSYIEEYQKAHKKNPKLTPREFVVKNYDHRRYARQILKGLGLK